MNWKGGLGRVYGIAWLGLAALGGYLAISESQSWADERAAFGRYKREFGLYVQEICSRAVKTQASGDTSGIVVKVGNGDFRFKRTQRPDEISRLLLNPSTKWVNPDGSEGLGPVPLREFEWIAKDGERQEANRVRATLGFEPNLLEPLRPTTPRADDRAFLLRLWAKWFAICVAGPWFALGVISWVWDGFTTPRSPAPKPPEYEDQEMELPEYEGEEVD